MLEINQSPSVAAPLTKRAGASWAYLYVTMLVATSFFSQDLRGGLELYLYLGFVLLFVSGCCFAAGQVGALHIALLPVATFHLLVIALPSQTSSLTVEIALTHLPLLVSTCLAARSLGIAFLGTLRQNLRYAPLVTLIGPLVGGLMYTVYPTVFAFEMGGQVGGGASSLILPGLALLLVGSSEELLFRGVVLTAVVAVLGPGRGVVVTTLLYSSLYIGQPWLVVGLMTVVGLCFGLIALRRGTLLGLALAHSLTNLTLLVLEWLLGNG